MIRLWPLIGLLALLSVLAILGLTPNEELDSRWPSSFRPGDKLMHGGGFAGIAWLLCHSGLIELVPNRLLQRILLPVGLVTLSFVSELMQSFLPYREWDWADVWWNLGGSAIGLTLYWTFRRWSYNRLFWTNSNTGNNNENFATSRRRTLVELEELSVLVHSDSNDNNYN